MKTQDLAELARSLNALQTQTKESGPRTDEELHTWIKVNLGMDIPRVQVCDDHVSPFTFIADLYFERVGSAVAMANRGGAKTMSSAIVHFLNSMFKPGCESVTVGAIEQQSLRAYENVNKLILAHGKVAQAKDHPEIISKIMRETLFANGSKLEILPGTVSAVNGPHPQKVHADEVELMDPSVFQESRNMSQTRTIIESDANGKEIGRRKILAQDWITSTRKRAAGPMQRILDAIANAEKNGLKPPYKLYVWCVFETAEQVPNCLVANPELPSCDNCGCDQISSGKWEDGTPRIFSDVCKGKLFRSTGFLDKENIWKRFQESDRDTWEAQQECSKPEVGGMVFKTWTKSRYGIKWWDPDPSFGPIFMGVDYGGTNPHGVSWYQVLTSPIKWWGENQTRSEEPQKILKAGTRVCFDELYVAEIGNVALAERVLAREREWREIHPQFRVTKRFADSAAKAARLDWSGMRPESMPTAFYCTRDIKEQIKTCNQVLTNDLFVVDLVRCPMFCEEADAYHYPEKKPEMEDDPEVPVDDFNHIMSEFRYTMENLKYLERRGSITSTLPKASGGYDTRSPAKSSAPRYMPRNLGPGDKWK